MSTFTVKLHELRRAKAKLKTEALGIIQREADLPDAETMPDAEAARLTAIETEMEALDGRISRVEAALSMEGDTSEPGEPTEEERAAAAERLRSGGGRLTGHGSGEPPIKDEKGFKIARFAIGLWHAKGGAGLAQAAQFIERRFGDKDVAKALNTAGASTGGALIPQAFATEFIELLRAETVIRKLNPVTIPMPLGNLTIPRLQGGATAGYSGELDDIVASQESFDDLQLNAKKLTALVPVSNDLIRRAPIGVEALVRDDLVQTVARREDLAFQLGDGSFGTPIGLMNLCLPTSKLTVLPFVAGSDNSVIVGVVSNVLQGMLLQLRSNMSRMIRPAWISSPNVESFLMLLRDNVGSFIYEAELKTGKLMGFPFVTTQQLPTNINTGSAGAPVNNGSFLMLADFADVIIGETYNVVIDASDVASYKDGSGTMVSSFVRDQTAFRVIEEHDFNMRHLASVAVAVLPGWSPAGYLGSGGAAYYVQAPNGDGSAAPSTFGIPPTGSNNPANISFVGPGGTEPGN